MVLVGYVLLVALGGLVAGLECKNGALEMIDEVGVGLFEQFLTKWDIGCLGFLKGWKTAQLICGL